MSASARRRSRFAVAVALLGLAGLATAPATFAAAPANDVYAGRVTVTDGSHVEQDTTEATTDADDTELNANCGAPATDASVWFELIGTDETYKIDFSGYSGGILVGTGSPGSFTTVSCGQFGTAFFASSGVAYAILAIDDQLDEDGLNGGAMVMDVNVIQPPSIDTFTVNSTARFHKDGSATVSGTLNCSNASFVEIDVQLQQTVGRLKVNGFSFSEGVCDGTTHTWSADVTGDNGLFRGGKATVNADLFICELDCIDQFVSKAVNIKK